MKLELAASQGENKAKFNFTKSVRTISGQGGGSNVGRKNKDAGLKGGNQNGPGSKSYREHF